MGEKAKVYYVALLVIVVLCGILYVFVIREGKTDAETLVTSDTNMSEDEDDDLSEETMIYVQLCGAIAQEGVLKVPEGTRVYEAVALAGGLTTEAASSAINQARILRDGEMIYFPTQEEAEMEQLGQAMLKQVNINIANQAELMTLPGIGESKANDIIHYREEHNGFETIEDIMKVDGIKEAMFNKIKDLITI